MGEEITPGLIEQLGCVGINVRSSPLVPPYVRVDEGPLRQVKCKRWNSSRCYRVRVQKKFDRKYGRRYREDLNILCTGGVILVAPEIYEMIKNNIGK